MPGPNAKWRPFLPCFAMPDQTKTLTSLALYDEIPMPMTMSMAIHARTVPYSQCCTYHTPKQACRQTVRAQPSIDDFILRSLYLCPVFLLACLPACLLHASESLDLLLNAGSTDLSSNNVHLDYGHQCLYNCALPIPTSRELPREFIIITNKTITTTLTIKQPPLSNPTLNKSHFHINIIHHVFHRQQGQGCSPPRQVSRD